MIINWESRPEKSIYYLGAVALNELKNLRFEVVGIDEFYQQLNLVQNISYEYYFLTLDWLFLLGRIELSVDGDLKVCF